MKKKSDNRSAFLNLRVLLAFVLCSVGVFMALLGTGAFSNVFAQEKSAGARESSAAQAAKSKAQAAKQAQPPSAPPDVVKMIGPVRQNQDLRSLPYVAPKSETEEFRLTRHPFPLTGSGGPARSGTSTLGQLSPLTKKLLRPVPNMPAPLLTFDGMNSVQSACGCLPPDSDGDVGPNHYVNAVNTRIKIFDKSGNPLNGTNGTTFNSFFSGLTGTPCANANDGDPFVMYDHVADRWVVSDFAFPAFPGSSFYQCIGVSQTPDPVSGGWFLYAVQVDPANPTYLGDYPKFGLWPDAYYLTMNLFSSPTTFNGVRVYALNRASMLTGGPANAIGFTLSAADVLDSYSFVAASFRTGAAPPAGRQEFILAVDSPASGGVTLTQVHARLFHVDFVTPANSTFGVGANHMPNAEITVNGFIDAFTNTTSHLVPQSGTTQKLDTLGDKIMTPLVYQNLGGTESLWASQTVCTEATCVQPTGTRWYQFNVTGGTYPATPVQQETWTNGNDGLWRWMGSIAVNQSGSMAIGYSTSSASMFPSIRYAGRIVSDPLNDLGQGEATMIAGGGSQTSTSDRWGDYSMLTIDPSDNYSFWHVNEYYAATAGASWFTRIGKFAFGPPPSCPVCPLYVTTTTTGNAIVPGTTDIGNHCDDCASPIALPFNVVLYGTTYTAGTMIQASSNGSLDFVGSAAPFGDQCPLPDTRIDRSILPFQDDGYTINSGYGIFTSVTGTAPNRNFNIEWRNQYFPGSGNANYEVVLHENTACFDIIYGATDTMGSTEESGVQKSAAGPATQFSCNTATLTNGLKVTYCPNNCPAPVPTAAVSRKVHGGAGTFDINLPLVPIGGAVGIEDRQQGAAGAVTLWYNGDFDGVNGLANENMTSLGQSAVYDNFLVPAGAGWDVTSVFSDNLENTNVTGATWEIRSGTTLLTTGGTLVASGSVSAGPNLVVTPTGRSGFGFTEFQVAVTGLSVHLPPNNPGEFYWLNVTPIGDGTGRSFDSAIANPPGIHCVGTPCGNDQNAFFNSAQFGAVFGSTADQGQPYDFSMGVKGTNGAGGGGFSHQIVVTFPTAVTVDTATVTAGNGSVASFSGSGTNTITVNLTDVTNAQRLGVTLGNVCNGTIAGDVLIPMGGTGW